VISLVDKVIAVCSASEQAAVPNALGGALALAYATEDPRGIRDIDVNVFVSSDPTVRVWWDEAPLDVFFAEAPYHHEVDRRCRTVPFAGGTIRILSAEDLAVFEAMFDRPKDWLGDDPRVARLHDLG